MTLNVNEIIEKKIQELENNHVIEDAIQKKIASVINDAFEENPETDRGENRVQEPLQGDGGTGADAQQQKGKCMNMYERYNNRELPAEIQRQAESFAWEGKSYGEELFRAGFWCGRNIREILEKTEAADENGEAD